MFNEETIKKLKYYVYKLIDPRNGEVFYVGKGKGNRIFNHIDEAIKSDENEDEVSLKLKRIRDIKNSGLEVIHIIHRHNMDEETAYTVEAALIDAYPGLTNEKSGYGSRDYGPMNTKEIKDLYSLETIKEFDKEDKLLIIKIRNENVLKNNNDIYETVKNWWKIGKKREEVKQVAAVINGVVKEVYKVKGQWEKHKSINRYGFEGEKIDSKYINKIIPQKYRKVGSANPIQYTF